MMQVPSLPNYMQYPVQQPAAQPNYNAVKIDIINPQSGVPAGTQAQYAQPTMPYYTYPQASLYEYPQAVQQPYYIPAQMQSVPACVPINQTTPAAPQTVHQQNINVPPVIVPQPVLTQNPISTVTEVSPVASTPKVEVVPPVAVTPQIDLNAFIAKLTNPDYEIQANAMEEIANMVKDEPQKATELLDEKIVTALNNIITADSSKLEGPTAAQISARQKLMSGQTLTEEENKLANTMTPMEQAERNKSYAMFTESIMQKLYGDEILKLSGTTVPLTELPGAVTIVEQLKDNPNPMVRASAIEALSYVQQPAYKNDLNTLFTIAQKDQDPNVREAATTALDKLSKI